MSEEERQQDDLDQNWQRVDARILGQLLAAQNLLFVLPDEARIAEFFSEALSRVPGVTSSFVCLGDLPAPAGAAGKACSECKALKRKEGGMSVMPTNFSCGWAARQDLRVIPLNTAAHTFGFFIFQTDSSGFFEPYWPFLNNLANYVALSLENRMQKHLLEQARDELEDRVRTRTEELRQMNERFSLAAHAARLGVWDWDLQRNELVWNDRMYELYGVKREDFAGAYEAWLQGVHPDDRALSDEISKQARRGERPYDTEFRVVWPDNSIHYLKAYGQFVRDGDGKPLRMTGINYDITERKRTEEALQDSERRLSEAQRIAHIGYWERNFDTNRIILSDEACRIFGLSPQEFPVSLEQWHQRWLGLIHPADQSRASQAAADALRDGPPYNVEYRIVRPGDEVRFIHSEASVNRDETGRPRYMLGMMQDITARKQAEEEVLRLNQELERRVADRTAQLEAANKELEAFAYSVSHDLRAPLRHIDGFLGLLQKKTTGAFDERSQHYMDTISEAANRMGVLIDDLLAFSRMGRHEMSKGPVELTLLVQGIIREYAPETQDRLVHWHIADLPTVTGDRAMLRAVMVNLIANALKFTRQRQPAEITIGCLPNQGNEIVIFVHDNGVGFDMVYIDKLFGVFQRLHQADEFEGTGIGLANVRRIINRHGGRTWAEGKVNQGATFYFSLPQTIQET